MVPFSRCGSGDRRDHEDKEVGSDSVLLVSGTPEREDKVGSVSGRERVEEEDFPRQRQSRE